MADDMMAGLGSAPDLSAFKAKPPQVTQGSAKPGFGQRFRQGMKEQSQKQGQQQGQSKKQYDLGPSFSGRSGAVQAPLAGQVPSYRKGGRVRKTGLALVHKGEFVVPAKSASRKASTHKRSIVKL
jgi:hypothetical protein